MDDLKNCIESIYSSDYKNIEVIVVDNASTSETKEHIKALYQNKHNFKLIENSKNVGAGAGRNIGAKVATGDFLLFIDDDNITSSQMIGNLLSFFLREVNCCMVGPLMLYKKNRNMIWLYYADINMYSSRAFYKGTGEEDVKQYPEIIEVGHLPNCFMVKKEDFFAINGFDEKFFIMYEESDLSERLKRHTKKKIYINSKAVVYHNIKLPNEVEGYELIGFKNKTRAFLVARNRVYFMKKNANFLQLMIFLLIYLPVITFYYEFLLIKNKSFELAIEYLKGTIKGLFY
ncbi:MAG: glycosyltransferase family 2 protein [Leptospiraceae bacterium]|nr:glycosyltransferase family 2 protein [Leptospiraceae bacterium]